MVVFIFRGTGRSTVLSKRQYFSPLSPYPSPNHDRKASKSRQQFCQLTFMARRNVKLRRNLFFPSLLFFQSYESLRKKKKKENTPVTPFCNSISSRRLDVSRDDSLHRPVCEMGSTPNENRTNKVSNKLKRDAYRFKPVSHRERSRMGDAV